MMSERISITEADLRQAMRDPRYWQAGHPERAVFNAWVTQGWQSLYPQVGGGASAGTVRVRAYSRTRNGHAEEVSAYTRSGRYGDDTQAQSDAAAPDSGAVSVEESPGEGILRRYTVRDGAGEVLGQCEAHLDGSQVCTINLPDGGEYVQRLNATEDGQLIPVQAQALPWVARAVPPLALGLYNRLLEALRRGGVGEGTNGDTPFILQYRGLEGDRMVERAIVGVLPNDRVEQFCPRTAEFQDIVTNSANGIERGTLSPQQWGMQVHQSIENEINTRFGGLNPSVRAEYSIIAGNEAVRGQAGSSRLDIIHLVEGTDQICVYDIKTGRRGLQNDQANRLIQ